MVWNNFFWRFGDLKNTSHFLKKSQPLDKTSLVLVDQNMMAIKTSRELVGVKNSEFGQFRLFLVIFLPLGNLKDEKGPLSKLRKS